MRCELNLRSGPPCITRRSSRNAVLPSEADAHFGQSMLHVRGWDRENHWKRGLESDQCLLALGLRPIAPADPFFLHSHVMSRSIGRVAHLWIGAASVACATLLRVDMIQRLLLVHGASRNLAV